MVIGLFKKPFNAARPGDNRDFVSPRGKKYSSACRIYYFPPRIFSPSPPFLFLSLSAKETSKKKRKIVHPHDIVDRSDFWNDRKFVENESFEADNLFLRKKDFELERNFS